MSTIQESNGLLADFTLDIGLTGTDRSVGGISDFTISPDARNIIDVPTVFGTIRDEVIVSQKQVITFTCSGVYIGSDRGQELLRGAYNNQDELGPNEIKFWINETEYFTPAVDSHILISSVDSISQSASGFATYEVSGVLVGDMQIQTSS